MMIIVEMIHCFVGIGVNGDRFGACRKRGAGNEE